MQVKFIAGTGLAEIYSDEAIKFALLNDKYEAIHKSVGCKDFISDLLWAEHEKRQFEIYGFKWTAGQVPIIPRMGLRKTSTKLGGHANKLEAFLNQWCEALKFEPCKVNVTDNQEHLVIDFDHQWFEQPIRMSLFTLLCRVGLTYDGTDAMAYLTKISKYDSGVKLYSINDQTYVKEALERMGKIFKTGQWPEQTFDMYKTAENVHYHSGIVGYEEPAKAPKPQKAVIKQ